MTKFINIKKEQQDFIKYKTITFIVPLMGREYNIAGFYSNIKNFYPDANIIFSVQNDNTPFKKRALFNLAFKYCNTDLIVFSDVDVRLEQRLDFNSLMKKHEKPFITYNILYNIKDNKLISSIKDVTNKQYVCTKEHFIKANGVITDFERENFNIYHLSHNKSIIDNTIFYFDKTIGDLNHTYIEDKISFYYFSNIRVSNINLDIQSQDPSITIHETTKKKISFNLATYPLRNNSLKSVIENLLSFKCIDIIRVYLNEYTSVPYFLNNKRIEYVIGGDNLKDTGKFFWASNYKNEYYFTLDDDLIIDETYIDKHIDKLNEYDNSIFISLHGKILNPNPKTFRDYTNPIGCLRPSTEDFFVNFPGTGVMVFDNSKFTIDYKTFIYHGMADLWIAKYLQEKKIPCLVRKHGFELTESYKGNDTLYNNRASLHQYHKIILDSITEWNNLKSFNYAPPKTKFDFCVNITTYNREEMLSKLLEQITSYKENIHINIFDDCSTNKKIIFDIINKYDNISYFRYNKNNGKTNYWKIFNEIFNICKDINANYYIFIPDDIKLKNNFFTKSYSYFNNINDKQKICLSLLTDEERKGKSCWTNFKPILIDNKYYKTQWNDLCFICDYSFFKALDFKILPIDKKRFLNKNISSGVGEQISKRLHNLDYSLYHIESSLVIHENHESKMNKEERKKHKLTSK